MDVGASERAQESVADGELLAGMRAGNSAAFAALMRSNNQRLYRLARGFLGNDVEAEEAVHDGYVNAFTHLVTGSGADRALRPGWRGSYPTKRSRGCGGGVRPSISPRCRKSLRQMPGPSPRQSQPPSRRSPGGRSAAPSRKR